MPKSKQKRKVSNAAYVAQTERTTSSARQRIIKWASITVILAILMSLMIAAISVSPSSAATPTSEPTVCAPIDTDGDAITNDVDPDIDGDEIVNGLDEDIDGDGIENGQDGNPASTNNVDSVPPRDARVETAIQWGGGIAVLAVLGWLVSLPYLRKRRGTSSRSVGSRGKSRD